MLRDFWKFFLLASSRIFKPLAYLLAPRGYFARVDWLTIQPRRIALVACHWIGDTFWASQVAPALNRRFPDAQLYAITKTFSADLWGGLVKSENVLSADAVVSDRRREKASWPAIFRRARELRRFNFDLVIDLTGNRYSAVFCFMLKSARVLGFEGGELGWLYSCRVPDARRDDRHLSEQPFRVIQPLLGEGADGFAYRLPLRPPQPTVAPEVMLAELGVKGDFYVIAPGAGWPDKQWPAEKFIQAGRQLALHASAVVVTGPADQRRLCEEVASAIPGGKILVGRSIGQVAAVLSQASGVLCNDSAIGHLAAALGRPTAVVFTGATDSRLCGPLGEKELILNAGSDTPIEQIVRHLSKQ